MDVDMPLVLSTVAQRITLKRLNTDNHDVLIELIASRTIRKGAMVRYYKGSPVYANPPKKRHRMKSYGGSDTGDRRNVLKVGE